MSKITKGSSFSGLLNYTLDDKKNAEIIATEGLNDFDKDSMIRGFETQASMNTRVAKKVGHISLNFLPEDAPKLSNKGMADVAKEYLKGMGIVDTQFAVVRHYDKNHTHCHIVFNRINNKGKTISDSNEHFKNARICKELKKKYGLTFSEGKANVNRERLKGTEKTKYQIYDALVECVPKSKNWGELTLNLIKHDINLELKTNGTTGKTNGVVFSKDDCSFSGSKIDKQFSYWNIERGFSQKFEQELSQKSNSPDDEGIVGASKGTWEDYQHSVSNLPTISSYGGSSPLSKPKNQPIDDEEEQKRKMKPRKTVEYKMS
ncbi:MAG: relaxase/mobilization nuclease domain-containing protein [Lentimicrobiaceae bacterium]|nr:relaxase/mobilization nuclease domain-containing protein [Lentimicrobiaceae bacterium]